MNLARFRPSSRNPHKSVSDVQFTHRCEQSYSVNKPDTRSTDYCLPVETNSTQEGKSMEAIGLLVTLEARAGKEADVEAFLKSAQPLALDEKATLKWYAIKLGPGKFGIFDTFANEAGRNAHLSGDIAKALGARASELFAVPPQVEKLEVLANTDPATTTFASANDLAGAMRRAEAAHGEHEKRSGQRDANWPDWYAAYMVAEQAGTELPK